MYVVVHILMDEDLPDKTRVILRSSGRLDPADVADGSTLTDHLDSWGKSLRAEGRTEKHCDLMVTRAKRLIALVLGANLCDIEPAKNARRADIALAGASLCQWVGRADVADLTVEKVQGALAGLKKAGRSLATCNHHRTAIRGFSKWCFDSHRTREHWLQRVKGYNAQADPRHERRALSLEELKRLISAAESGPKVLGVPGPTRALVYRLAVASGLRYSELASITAGSFDWLAPSVAVAACYAKNGERAVLPVPGPLAEDLKRFTAKLRPIDPLWRLPPKKGAHLIRADLASAGIPYQTPSGFFDFHSLRCETATLADQAGVPPRVVQRLMRHSTLELTDRYTKPRDTDVHGAASRLPDLRPNGPKPETDS